MDRMETQELISALADGQLRGEAFARAVQKATDEDAARETWRTYHLIGDVLRSNDLARSSQQERFVSQLRQRLQSEPRFEGRAADPKPAVIDRAPPAVNERRWKTVAVLTSVVAVVTGGWGLQQQMHAAQPQLASAPAAVADEQGATGAVPAMIRDPRLDELLAAHRQLGSATALQTPAGFVRSAAFERAAR